MKPGISLFLIFSLFLTLEELAAAGGPDGFGYCYESTQDPGDTICFFWLDPIGHELITNWQPNPDDGWVSVPLPARFPFYGDTLDSIVICSNGFLQFPTTYTSYRNQSLPAAQFPRLIALFWDDLNLSQGGSVLYHYDSLGMFTVITWLNVPRFNTAELLSAQVILHSDGKIQMNYLRTDNGTSTTIGIQSTGGNNDYFLQYVFDGEPSRHIPRDSTAILFYVRRLEYDAGILHPLSPSTWIPRNQPCPIMVTVKNFGSNSICFPVSALIIRINPPRETLFNRSQNINLSPGDTIQCYLGDFIPPPTQDSWNVRFQTALPGDQYPRNDTFCFVSSSHPPVFGTVISSWNLTQLGDGMNLTGITYSPDSNRFYIATNTAESNRIYSFPVFNPLELRPEPFNLANFFNDDIVWGIAWDQQNPGFWLIHNSFYGDGTIAARYATDGSFTGDTWNLNAIEAGAWSAGIDQEPAGNFYLVMVGGSNRIYHLNLNEKQVLDYLPGPVASWRACSYLGHHNRFIFSGGWNENLLIQIDNQGNITQSAPLADLADLDLYQPPTPCPDSFIWAYATTSSYTNTIHQISLGTTWADIGIKESPPISLTPSLNISTNPVVIGKIQISIPPVFSDGVLRIYDPLGRMLHQTPIAGRPSISLAQLNPPLSRFTSGIYLITLSTRFLKHTQKLVVLIPAR